MDKIEAPKKEERNFHAHFTPKLRGGDLVLKTKDLCIGYDEVLAKINLEMYRGDRIGILGPNGTGKSTFLKTLVGDIKPISGDYRFGHQIEIGYFDQQLAQFSSSKTVLEELWDEYPDLEHTTIRKVLGQFLFTSEEVFKTVDVLSGGEKVRLSFAKLLLAHGNCLILDEPTNHLDIPGKEAFEEALKGYEGTILFVSHDRYFLKEISTKLLIFSEDGAEFVDRPYGEYQEGEVVKEKKEKREKKKTLVMNEELIQKEIKKIEEKITEKEKELEELRELRFEPEYYQDSEKMNELDEEIDDIHNEISHLLETWEEYNK